MRTVTIHQPEHLPWLGFFHKVAQADVLVILDTVQYRKNYFGNRNRLVGPNGPFYVTVPVHLKGHIALEYREIPICTERDWKDRYRKSVSYNYRRHPYFDRYWPELEALLSEDWGRLADLNERLIRWLLEAFEIRPALVRASELDPQGSSTDLLVDLCLKTGARCYLSGALGKEYMDESRFTRHGMEVRHNDFQHVAYPQRGQAEFVSHLSALDLLLNCGVEGRRYLVANAGGSGAEPALSCRASD